MSKGEVMHRGKIPFSLPTHSATEEAYVLDAMRSHHRHGSGPYTARAVAMLTEMTSAKKVLLTHSCTGALEMAMLLMDIGVGDEVIMPSYTFSSTANAVVLRGAIPVFADIDPRTQCLNPNHVEQLITPRTRALLPVHYAGVSCDMDALCRIAKKHSIAVIEDAAQTIGSRFNGRALGTFGELGALSFHDSKNISSGEGGALLINDPTLIERAEILWEKGTNRSQFMRGQVDKYTWVDIGSSFLPSEVTSAFLLGQLERTEEVNHARVAIWDRYFAGFAEAEAQGLCMRPFVPASCTHNGHIFYLILPDNNQRNHLLSYLQDHDISATFHYVPLHDSPAGKKYGKAPFPLPNTAIAGHCLLRLPLFPELTVEQQARVIDATNEYLLSQLQSNYQASQLGLTGISSK